MDTTGVVDPWSGHPQKECPVVRPDFSVIGGKGPQQDNINGADSAKRR